jgi:hypothetical protein
MCFVIYLLLFICAYSQGKEKKEASPLGEVFFKKGIHSSPSVSEGALGEGYFFKKTKGASPSARA